MTTADDARNYITHAVQMENDLHVIGEVLDKAGVPNSEYCGDGKGRSLSIPERVQEMAEALRRLQERGVVLPTAAETATEATLRIDTGPYSTAAIERLVGWMGDNMLGQDEDIDRVIEAASVRPQPEQADGPEPALERGAGGSIVLGDSEASAQRLYETWSDQPGWVPWVPGGNSDKQNEARRQAHRIETDEPVAPGVAGPCACGKGYDDDGDGDCPACGAAEVEALSEQPNEHIVDGFIAFSGPGFTSCATVRDCLGCGCLVPGGPTRCRRCAAEASPAHKHTTASMFAGAMKEANDVDQQ